MQIHPQSEKKSQLQFLVSRHLNSSLVSSFWSNSDAQLLNFCLSSSPQRMSSQLPHTQPQGLVNHTSVAVEKDFMVPQSPGSHPPSPAPTAHVMQIWWGESWEQCRSCLAADNASSQENSSAFFGQHPQKLSRTDSHTAAVNSWFYLAPLHSLRRLFPPRGALRSHSRSACPTGQTSPKSAHKPFGGLRKPAQLSSSSQNLLFSRHLH